MIPVLIFLAATATVALRSEEPGSDADNKKLIAFSFLIAVAFYTPRFL